MYLAEIWRYPVKSLRGESLIEAQLTDDGVAGDRLVHVVGARGPVTGRTRHGLLTISACTGHDGMPLVEGHRWNSPEALRTLRARAGPDVRLIAYQGPERFDVLNLLVATDGAVEEFGHGLRRLRPNLVIGGVPADAEATWRGGALTVGEAVVGVHSMRQRCVVTTIDPDSGVQDVKVLKRIHRDFRGELALNCWVIQPGTVRRGDSVSLIDTLERPSRIGGWVVGAPYRVPD